MFNFVLHSLVLKKRTSLYEMFYAVSKGREIGIFPTWAQCEAQVKGFPGAKFKKFSSKEEAESFISGDSSSKILQEKPSVSQTQQALIKLEKNVEKHTPVGSSTSSSSFSANIQTNLNPQSSYFYAVAKGKSVGIFHTWAECKAQIEGLRYAKYRKFTTLEEAQQFITENQDVKGNQQLKLSQAKDPLKSTLAKTSADSESCLQNLKTTSFLNYAFQCDENGYVHCYTDGSCEGNGKSSARAGIGVWFGADHPLNVSKPVCGPPTNNVAEIQAATAAIKVAQDCGISKLQINTDSQFLINCVTQWMPKWQKNGWKLSTGGDVKNKEQLEQLHNSMKLSINVKWNYVKAHIGIMGNEHADMLAKAGAANYKQKTNKTSSGIRFQPY